MLNLFKKISGLALFFLIILMVSTAFAGWNDPYTTIYSTGNRVPTNGTLIPANYWGKILKVHDYSGGWFKFEVPATGSIRFTVLAKSLPYDTFSIRLYRMTGNNGEHSQIERLYFSESAKTQTGLLKNVKKGEMIYFWDDDGSGRAWTLNQEYLLKIESVPEKKEEPKEVVVSGGIYKLRTRKGLETQKVAVFYKAKYQNAENVVIKNTVKFGDKTYKVMEIAPLAFEGMTKLKQVTIGKNVDTIGNDTFKGCKNLRSVIINSTLLNEKTVDVTAFKGINTNAYVECPKGRVNDYQKLLKTKGMSKKTMFFVTGEKPASVITYTSTNKTATVDQGEKWTVKGILSIRYGFLGRITINSPDIDSFSMSVDFNELNKKYMASVNLKDYFTIDTSEKIWSKPGTYRLRIWAIDLNGNGGKKCISELTLVVEDPTIAKKWCYPATVGTYLQWNGYSKTMATNYNRPYHVALDLGTGKEGEKVVAAATGKVTYIKNNDHNWCKTYDDDHPKPSTGNGNQVVIEHILPDGSKCYSFYAHLKKGSVCVKVGDFVKVGQKIGEIGHTGTSSNGVNHCHFSIVDTKGSNFYGYVSKSAKDTHKNNYGNVTYYDPVYVIVNAKLP